MGGGWRKVGKGRKMKRKGKKRRKRGWEGVGGRKERRKQEGRRKGKEGGKEEDKCEKMRFPKLLARKWWFLQGRDPASSGVLRARCLSSWLGDPRGSV